MTSARSVLGRDAFIPAPYPGARVRCKRVLTPAYSWVPGGGLLAPDGDRGGTAVAATRNSGPGPIAPPSAQAARQGPQRRGDAPGMALRHGVHVPLLSLQGLLQSLDIGQARSEERRVGKEGRSRWSPYH